jgi:hypothetical protein
MCDLLNDYGLILRFGLLLQAPSEGRDSAVMVVPSWDHRTISVTARRRSALRPAPHLVPRERLRPASNEYALCAVWAWDFEAVRVVHLLARVVPAGDRCADRQRFVPIGGG